MQQTILKSIKFWIMIIPLLLFAPIASFGQDQSVTVRGTITSVLNEEPLPGVSVLIKGTSNGTITDIDGNYAIEAPSSESVLVFSFVGFLSEEVTVGNQTNISISLAEDITSLSEVVVVGYGTQKKEAVTAAISNVSSKDLQHVPAANTSSLLAGKLPGLAFRQADGRPGATSAIQIRNMGTPLFVIDGIQKDQGQFNQLSPNDIESITILKDASAAVYGSRAANGVVLVTTKRGQLGENPQVNINGYYGIQNWTRFPETVNAYEYQKGTVEAFVNDGQAPNITSEELALWEEGTEPGYRSFDWYDFIVEGNAPQAKVNLNVSGGSEKTNYYFSVTHLDQGAVFGSDFEFKRTNIQANIDTRINKRLKVGLDINGRVETTKNPGLPHPDDYWMPRFALFRNRPTERPFANDNPLYPAAISNIETNWALLNYETSGSFQRDWRVAQANLRGEYEIFDGLVAKGLASYWFADRVENNFEYTYDVYRYDEPTDSYIDVGGNDNPYRSRGTSQLLEYVLQGQLDYNKVFGDKHTVGGTFVVERIERNFRDHFQHAVPNTNFIDLMYFDELDGQGYADNTGEEARIGYVGRLSYAFDRKYYVEASGRRDASWKFTEDDRWGNYFSVSAGWRISEEPFFQALGIENVLNDLKIRASYGELGDDQLFINGNPLDPFAYITGYTYPQGVFINDGEAVITARDRGIPIRNLTWYTSKISDIGLDFELFSGKLTGAIDGFIRKRTGLNAANTTVIVPDEIGYSLPQENLESDIQQGGEVSLFYQTTFGEVEFGVGGNYAYSRRKWDAPAPENHGNSWDEYRWSRVDRYDGIYWGYEIIGQFESQEQINNHPINNDGQGNIRQLPGDLIYKDVNGDGVINYFDERPIGYRSESGRGDFTPLINFGFNLSASYKGFDIIADFSGGAGYTFVRNWELRNPFQATGNLLAAMYDSRWHRVDPYDPNSEWVAGDAPALRPNGDHVNYNRNSDYWLRNVRYLRARTIEVGYSLPQSLLEKVKIQRARVSLSSYNLFSIDNVKEFGIDPEAAEHNGLQYPQNRIFNLGFDITF